MDISFESKIRGIRWNYQVGLTFRSKVDVSNGTIGRDYQLEAMVEVSGGNIKWTHHLNVKAEVSGGTIRWD